MESLQSGYFPETGIKVMTAEANMNGMESMLAYKIYFCKLSLDACIK